MSNENLKNRLTGKFIVFDGPDGCGKSTQTKLIAQWLQNNDVAVEIFRDPGDTVISEKIRQILLNPEHIAMSTSTEVLLYMAARVQLWTEKIAPALKQNICVIMDRWISSTCAYQGYAGGFGIDKIIQLATDCIQKPCPDLTVILDVDQKTGLTRLLREFDRIEQKGDAYHQKVREGFLELAKSREDFAIVDAAEDIKTVQKKIIEVVQEMF